jgi:flagellar biosynthesis protein FliR
MSIFLLRVLSHRVRNFFTLVFVEVDFHQLLMSLISKHIKNRRGKKFPRVHTAHRELAESARLSALNFSESKEP